MYPRRHEKTTALAAALVIACLFIALMSAPQPARAAGDDKVSPWVTAAVADGGSTEILVVLAEQADLSSTAAVA